MGGKEHVALTEEEIQEIYNRAYEAGYSDGFDRAYSKVYWDDGK